MAAGGKAVRSLMAAHGRHQSCLSLIAHPQRKLIRHGCYNLVLSSPFSSSPSSPSGGTEKEGKEPIPIQSHLKNPIVQKLWAARSEAKRRIALDISIDSKSSESASNDDVSDVKKGARTARAVESSRGKHPSESETSIDYPFSTDEFLLETYRNPWGEMRFGKILEDLDALAGNIAFNHVVGNPLIVTAGVDRISVRERPVIGADQHLSGKVTWVGSSSMEIRMKISASVDCDEWLEAYFTFVTLDPKTKRPTKIATLAPETDEEQAHFELGALKAAKKKQTRRSHSRVGGQVTDQSLEIDRKAAELLAEAGPLLRMPSLADPNTILMGATAHSNALVAQPQGEILAA